MQKKSMADNRFLLGISKKEIGYKAQDRIICVCEQMEMPSRLLEIFRNCILDANYVHFGFEENQNTSLYKVYVEFWNSIREELKKSNNSSSKSYLMHLGFKWDAFLRNRP